MATPSIGSLPMSERIATLDIILGFALLGILIMNMPGFSSSFFAEADGSHQWTGQLDQVAANCLMQTAICTAIFYGWGFACGARSDQPQDSCWR